MKSTPVIFFALISVASCYEYTDLHEVMQKTFETVDFHMNLYANVTLENFYKHSAEGVNKTFQLFAQKVVESRNPYAIAHVVDFRRNYTGNTLLLKHLISDARSEISKTFAFQQQNIAGKKRIVEETSNAVYEVLKRYRCNDTEFENFYENLITETGNRVIELLRSAVQANFDNLTNQFVPFTLYNHFIDAQMECLVPVSQDLATTTDCMVQKDDLYLATTLEAISRTLKAITSLINHFNLKVTHAAISDIDKTFVKAYKDAYTIVC